MSDTNFFILPVRSRDDYTISVYTDEAGKYRWRMTEITTEEIRGAATEGFESLKEMAEDCWICTGWLPDEFSTAVAWDNVIDVEGPGALEA